MSPLDIHNDDCTGVHTILTVRRTYNGGIKPGWTDVTEHRWCGDHAHVRRTLINVPARLARSARRIILHLPEAWPWQTAFDRLFTATHAPPPPAAAS